MIDAILDKINDLKSRVAALETQQVYPLLSTPMTTNGVAYYLSSDKKLHTNSALTFNGSTLNVNNSSNLSSVAASESSPLLTLDFATSNRVKLQASLYRTSTGSDWTTAALLLRRVTDVSNQAYISLHGNNVGINVAAPAYSAEVNSQLTVSSAIQGQSLYVKGTAADVGLRIDNTGTSGRNWAILVSNSSSGLTASNLHFYDYSNSVTRMTLGTTSLALGLTNPRSDFPYLVLNSAGSTRRAGIQWTYGGASGGMFEMGTDAAQSLTQNWYLYSYFSNSFPLFSTSGGLVSINQTANGGYNLDVNGSAAKTTGTLWTNTSTEKSKNNISTIPSQWSAFKSLRPISAEYNGKYTTKKGQKTWGFVAEELQPIYPDAVQTQTYTDEKGNKEDYLATTLDVVMVSGWQVLQEAQARIESLENRCKTLEATVSSLQSQLAAMQSRLADLESVVKIKKKKKHSL